MSLPKRSNLLLACAVSMALAALLIALSDGNADAVTTRSFLLDDASSLAAGELEGTAVHSRGHVTIGLEARRLELPAVELAYSLVRRGDLAYVGTGNEGKIFRVRGDAVEEFAATGQLLVSALALDPEGTLYAGTIPEGRIFAISPAGEMRELSRPEGAEHVWALAYDAAHSRLFAGTGPEGKIFAIDARGNAELYYDASAGHVMSLALDGDGSLYAGTSEDALVLRLRAPGRAEVVYDFPGNEITALDVRDGVLAVAANEFPDPPAASPSTSTKSGSARTKRSRPGKGRLWRVGADGRAERVFAQEEGHFACVQLAADGTIFAGDGKEGRIHRVGVDRTSATWIDVDERQVLDLDLEGESPLFVTGDQGAVYRVVRGSPETATWTSKVLDARFVARWGRASWRGSGRLEVQTRSGNTEEPDGSWSEFSAPITTSGPIRSPAARFLQVRVRFLRDPAAVLHAIELFYLPQNQRAIVTALGLKRPGPSKSGASPSASSRYPLEWSVANADGDTLRYRLRFREESQQRWRSLIPEEEELTDSHHTWETSGIPDGWYVVQVEASDELDNPETSALRSVAESEPILIDNHPPRVEGLEVRGGVLVGRALDTLGPIQKLELAIDGGPWRIFFPEDDLLDSAEEQIRLDLPPLEPGSHILAVRATDAGRNVTSAETTLTTRGR